MVPMNFLLSVSSAEDLARLSSADIAEDWQQFLTGERCWSLKSFLVLRDLGAPVSLSQTYCPDAINFAHPVFINRTPPETECFLVSLQADYSPCRIASLRIVQNRSQLVNSRDIWIPHWPNDGIVPRSKDRAEVETVGYTGMPFFLADGVEEWSRRLGRLGFRFRVLPANRCNDFSEIDVCVGVRSFNKKPWRRRPAWKLINAWHAKVPFLGGWDSAYSQIGSPGVDYIRVFSWADVVTAMSDLRRKKGFFQSFLRRADQRRFEFSTPAIAQYWVNAIQEKIEPEFLVWRRQGKHKHQRIKRILWRHERMARDKLSLMRKLMRIKVLR